MTDSSGPIKTQAVAAGILGLVLFALYAPTLGFATIPTWDDTNFVVFRPEILDWWGSTWTDRLINPNIGYPIPIPTALYAMLRGMLGPDGYYGVLHGIHVVLHLMNAWLVGLLARRWMPDGNPWAAPAVAAAWAFHPVLVESVAWLTNTKTLLSATAILGALWLYGSARSNLTKTMGLLGLFVLAIGSRPDGAILPWVVGFVAVARHVASADRPKVSWRAPQAVLAGLAVVSLPYVAWTSAMHEAVAEHGARDMSPLVETLFRIGRAAELSAASIAWPFELHPSYFFRGDETLVDGLPGLGLALLVVGLGVLGWKRKNTLLATGAAVLVATYVPYSNLVFIPRLAADTYLYLPTFGVLLMLAALVLEFGPRADATWSQAKIPILFGLLTLFGATLTWSQVHRWENTITLWAPVIEYEPWGDRSYRHVAFAYYVAGDMENAAKVIERGLPHFERERDIPWYAIPVLREAQGPVAAAEVAVRAALTNTKLDPLVQKQLIETLLIGQLPVPKAPEVQNVVRRAAEAYLSNAEWMANPTAGPAIRELLAELDR